MRGINSLGARRLWRLYAAPGPPAAHLPDSFRDPPAAVVAFMVTWEVSLIIDAFHDNTDWCVALNAERH